MIRIKRYTMAIFFSIEMSAYVFLKWNFCGFKNILNKGHPSTIPAVGCQFIWMYPYSFKGFLVIDINIPLIKIGAAMKILLQDFCERNSLVFIVRIKSALSFSLVKKRRIIIRYKEKDVCEKICFMKLSML